MKKINPKTRNLLLFISAAAITFLVYMFIKADIDKRVQTQRIAVALNDIKPFEEIQGKWTFREVVKSEIPDDAITSEEELKGELYAGEIGFYTNAPLLKSMVTDSSNSLYGDSLGLEKGQRLVGIKVDQAQGAGSYIKPGILVDAFAIISNEMGTTMTGPGEDKELSNLLVKGVFNSENSKPGEDGRSLIPAIVVVQTTSDSVTKKLVRYQEEGKVYLTPSGVPLNKE